MKSGYIGLWLLLSVALIVISIISFSNDFSFLGYKLKKSPIAETLLYKEEISIDTADTDQFSDTIVEIKEVLVEIDTMPQNIMMFGDSMLGGLAKRMAKYAKQNGHSVHSIIWDSSTTRLWAESDTLEYFLNKYKPSFVFISLGSNELYLKEPRLWKPYVERILKKLGDIPYVWIGPPNWRKDSGVNDMIEETTKPNTFFRSEGMHFDRKSDKIHPTTASSALWLDSVMRWLPKSAHPILAEMPSDSIGKVNTGIVYLKALNAM